MKKICIDFGWFKKLFFMFVLSGDNFILKGLEKEERVQGEKKRTFPQKVFSSFPAIMLVLLFAGCASSERMMRLSPASARAYSAPDAKRLKSVSYRNMERPEVKNKTLADENVINVWPFFLKNDYFHSILWPFIDYDQYGVAVRPFYNKEGDEHSILFPLAGWNSADDSGWVLNTFWSKDKFTVFPFYHHKPDYLYVFPVDFKTYESGKLERLNIYPLSFYGSTGEKSDDYYYILLPFGGWLKEGNESCGMILNTYWGDDYAGSFPFFHKSTDAWMALLAYKNKTRYGFFPLFAQNIKNDGGYFFPLYMYSKSDTISFVNVLLFFNHLRKSNNAMLNEISSENNLCLLFYYGSGKEFHLTQGSVNSVLWYQLDSQCQGLKKAFENSDMQKIINYKKMIANSLKSMKIDGDFAVPANEKELKTFCSALQKRFGIVDEKKSFAVFPLYSSEKNMNTDKTSLLLGLLHSSQNYRRHDQRMPATGGKIFNNAQLVEKDSSSTLVLASKSEELKRNFKTGMTWEEQWAWYYLEWKLENLAKSLERDEARSGDKLYKSETPELLKTVNSIAATLGLSLPELKTAAQCYIYGKELQGMALEYFKTENVSLFPLFEYEKGDYSNRFELFPLFFADSERYSKYRTRDRLNILLLCHNQAVRDRVPQGKLADVINELDNFEEFIHRGKGKHNLQKAMQEANLALAMPENYRECRELREKIYAMSPENTERISAFFPLYFYCGNDVLDDSYLNILGILYNGGHKKQDSWFNVLGFVARGFEEKDEEEFRILEFLYRSRKRGDEKDYLIFPFFYYRESPTSSQFSFLHRIVNIEKSSTGTKGHIFYIPFGDEK